MTTLAIKDKRPILWDSGMLPEPTITFTIPSIYHDTQLECRIYHPKQPSTPTPCPETKAAIIAHPYAPMGGCFDDHVLHAVGLEFLNQSYILGLFNLRGAGASQGHTSWSSKPEQDDYCSFIGFLSYYMNELQYCYAKQSRLRESDLQNSVEHKEIPDLHSSNTMDDCGPQERHTQQVLVLGGYSYGSFIVRQLPDISKIVHLFMNPITGTAAAEIKLRATHLAQEHLHKNQTVKPSSRNLMVEPCHDSSVYGGDESQPGTRKISHEPRRSFEIVKKGVEKTRARFSKHHHDVSGGHRPESETSISGNVHAPEIRYLLISPLLPPVSTFLALSSHWWKADPVSEERLRNHQSLAIWGSNDFFTSSKRLHKWAGALKEAGESRFEYTEFPGVGHFWLEATAEIDLRQTVRSWIEKYDEV